MTILDVYNINKEKVTQVEVDESIFDADVKEHLFYEIIRAQLANRRSGTACTKTRGEVSGGGRKPWKQKGTGRARVWKFPVPRMAGWRRIIWPKAARLQLCGA